MTETVSTPSDGPAPRSPARVVAAVVTGFEGLVLLGFCVFYVVEIMAGATDDTVRALTSGTLILICATFLLAAAVGWWRGADWPRVPTLVWNGLLLPVAWSLQESGRTLVALVVAAVAVTSLVCAVRTPWRDRAVS